jgi:exopolysaccharide production protein ExoZ
MIITPTTIPQKLEWLQVGRFLAAFWVLIHHGEGQLFNGFLGNGVNWHSYGNLGVDFFFCLSGFIIIFRCWNSFGETESSGKFLQRRIVRIYPLIWLIMVVQLLAACFTSSTQTPSSWSTLLSDALLLPSAEEHTINVAWTLRHEMFFYGITALAMIFRPIVAFYIALVWLGAIILSNFTRYDLNLIESFLLSNWNLLFLTGVFVAFLYQKENKSPLLWTISGFAVFVIGSALFISGNFPNAHVPENLAKMISSALVFGGLLVFLIGLDLKQVKAPKILVILGDASYSIYLIHSTVLAHLRYRLDDTPLQIASLVAIPVILCVSVGMFRYFERPSGPFFRKMLFKREA